MTDDEFDDYSNGIQVNSSTTQTVLKLIQTNIKVLSELRDKQRLIKQEANKLQEDMNKMRLNMQSKFNKCLTNNKMKYTNNIEGFQRENVLDNNKDVLMLNKAEKLQPPLLPQSITNSNNNNNNSNQEPTTSNQVSQLELKKDQNIINNNDSSVEIKQENVQANDQHDNSPVSNKEKD
jgi:hypothetical protein